MLLAEIFYLLDQQAVAKLPSSMTSWTNKVMVVVFAFCQEFENRNTEKSSNLCLKSISS